MSRTGVVFDPVFKDHDTGPGHPERPERLDAIFQVLEDQGMMAETKKIELREATFEELMRVHTKTHIERIKATSGKERSMMDMDTPTSSRSYDTALLAAGGLLNAVEAVVKGELENAIALVRPPGHHAESDRAMGFCLFNNIAVAARYALEVHGLERILIVDWDVHHGNGTQHSFYSDPRVLYFSTHRYPFYPGSGGMGETGEAEGKGYTVNIPLPAGCGDPIYDAAYKMAMLPVARGFRPELVLVSAGFDLHRLDPLGGMEVSEEGFARIAGTILDAARELCQGRVVITLEGGYHLEGQARAVGEVTSLMMEKKKPPQGELELDPGFQDMLYKLDESLDGRWPGIGG